MAKNIALIGECMLELTHQTGAPGGRCLPMNLSYGGDTLNAAVYLARQGIAVDYVTALGDDPMSAWMTEQWRSEGVACGLIDYQADTVPGLYLIETDKQGERSFYYWRESAPARRLLDDPVKAKHLFSQLEERDWLCLSGITLAIFSEAARQRLYDALADYRRHGGRVAFDSNYRPKLWPSRESTREAYEAMYRLTDLALPTIEDEQLVFGDAEQSDIVDRLQSWGVSEIALKMGEHGCLVVTDQDRELVAANPVRVVDTTSAGDSFNAGYLAARLKGLSAADAAAVGHRLASVVIQHSGAIIPRDAMPKDP
ncbi:sugar kinase [Seongchinamella unica]|uniref:2-dehydro-3-deoxygluconokinase n=1 Tax=Seongchinamella unica TaxID=2547392 RepID=A0A4R5LMS9_9GAMM|nr:sugar kinase [Seongchinamella unica]TDG11300.1 sugar kinase [Seongchinamella unica]